MFTRYLLVAFRYFKKNKVTTTINVVGLSIGLTAALFVFLIIEYNFSFDRYEPAKDRIYRVVSESPGSHNPGAPLPLYGKLVQNTAGVEDATVIVAYAGNADIALSEGPGVQPLKRQDDIYFTDSAYFRLFPHTWLAGNPFSAMRLPNQVVLAESRLQRYFPGTTPGSALGRAIVLDGSIHLVVSGVVKDLKVNTDFDGKLFISLPTMAGNNLKKEYGWEEWGRISSRAQMLLLLKPGVQRQAIDRQIAATVRTFNTDPHGAKNIQRLQPLSDVHTNADFDGRMDKAAIGGLILLATILVLLGAINFINLATAESTQRAREVSIRKVLGSSRRSLVLQFLLETGLLMLTTTCLCLTLIMLGLNQFLPADFNFNQSISFAGLLGFVVGLSAAVSLLSGLYPAFVVSRFRPVNVLKGQGLLSQKAGGRSAFLRKALTVSQFVVAQVFVIGVIIINKQVHFAINKDMGFRKDAILLARMPADHKRNILLNALRNIPEIQKASIGGQPPAFSGQMFTNVQYMHKGRLEPIGTDIRQGDSSWLSVYQIHLLAGSQAISHDSGAALVINETLSHDIGFVQARDAVGQTIYVNDKPRHISGVMEDFNQGSVRRSIQPLYFEQDSAGGNVLHLALKANPASWKPAIDKLQGLWKELYPGEEFSYEFLNEEISRIYKQDQMVSRLLSFCAIVAIVISCMGLFGLVTFMTKTRSREISIRKVFGASSRRIFEMLSLDLLKSIVLAFGIAVPIAFWGGHIWLQTFAYKTSLSWWVFIVGGVIILAISFAVIGLKTIKAATANPVNGLRNL